MKRIRAFLCSALLLSVSVFGAVPAVHALGNNLIANPSVEQATAGKPTGWSSDSYGTNTPVFSYKTGGHTGTYSLNTKLTTYKSGDAKWYFSPVNVAANTSYTFSDWYQSGITSSVDAEITSTTGAVSYIWLGDSAASTAWKQNTYTFKTPANAAKVTIYHSIDKVGDLTVDDYSLATTTGTTPTPTPTPTAPTVSVTAPVGGATVSGTTALSANASDTIKVSSVQFKVDGINVGTADTTAPYSINWDSKTVANGTRLITAVATNSSNLSTSSTSVPVNVTNAVAPPAPTAPAVAVTAPSANATVSGTTTVTASASDAQSVSSVQFKVDGTNVGTADTTAPYSYDWNTKTVSNGAHTITATAINATNLTTTSAPISVTVNNPVAVPVDPTNLLANPSLESTANGTAPDSWLSSNWGTNTSTFSYLNTGHTGNRSLQVQTSAYTNGAANWYYNDVAVTAGSTYQYSNWYKSDVDTEVDAEVTMSDGTVQYFYLGSAFANANWTQFKTTFTIPSGGKSAAIYQILAKKGTLTTDDYALTAYTPVAFNRGIVSLTFDDGWANQYQNANPILKKLGFLSTYYIISGSLNDTPDYMSSTQVKDLYANGNEIGSHSVSHPDFTTLSTTQMTNEFKNSQTTLQNLIGAPVTDFAYPYGSYNASTIAAGSQYYGSQRSVNAGLNTKDNLNVTQLKIHEVDSNISTAQVQAWIDEAIASKAWLILTYHEVATTPSAADDALYTTSPADFSNQMNYLKSTGASVQTVKSALAEVKAQ